MECSKEHLYKSISVKILDFLLTIVGYNIAIVCSRVVDGIIITTTAVNLNTAKLGQAWSSTCSAFCHLHKQADAKGYFSALSACLSAPSVCLSHFLSSTLGRLYSVLGKQFLCYETPIST